MKIYSNFKDYYDGVVPYDPDDNVHYIRNKKEITDSQEIEKFFNKFPQLKEAITSFPSLHNSKIRLNLNNYLAKKIFILFCNKLHVVYQVYKDWKPTFLKSFEELVTFYKESNEHTLESSYWDSKALKKLNWYKQLVYKTSIEGVDLWHQEQGSKDFLDIHQELNTPVVLFFKQDNKYVMQLNPNLQEIEFQRIVDPYTAYQEIDMFLGNVLVKNKEPPLTTGGDQILRDSHGFDEWSFKNPSPGQKKRKNKK